MPPQVQPTNAVPLVTRAQVVGLVPRHRITLVTVVGSDPAEGAALRDLEGAGVEVHAIWRREPRGFRRWQRRFRILAGLAGGRYPHRSVWYWEAGVQRLLDRLLAEGRFDVVAIEDNAMGMYRYGGGVPTVFTEHEVRRPRGIDWGGWRRLGWRQWVWNELDWHRWDGYQREVWGRFDRVVVFTERDARAFCALVPGLAERVRVNPFGIELPPVADVGHEEPGTVVFSGGFSHLPNVDAALWLGREIMPLLRRVFPGVRLTIVGSYPPPEVCALASEDTVVTGRVPAVEPFIERAAVVVAPIRIGGGMRVKVLQGMAMGKAVVTTPLGADGLTLGGGMPPLRVAGDAGGFAQAVAQLLVSDGERFALGREARAFVAQYYSAEAYAQRLERIYAEVQPRGGGG